MCLLGLVKLMQSLHKFDSISGMMNCEDEVTLVLFDLILKLNILATKIFGKEEDDAGNFSAQVVLKLYQLACYDNDVFASIMLSMS
jgi:hypothetical protein